MKLPGLSGSSGPKRPWLAGVLGLVLTGLGHAYLRRWARGLGWLAAAYAVAVLFVPASAAESLAAGEPVSDPTTVLAPLAVVVASAVDAYLLARRTQSQAGEAGGVASRMPTPGEEGPAGAGDVGGTARGGGTGERGDASAAPAGEPLSCPACGKDLDAELDFCPWCTTELDRPGPNGNRSDG